MKVIRVYDSVRTAHLERLPTSTPGALLFRSCSYDFDAAIADSVGATRMNRWKIIRRLLRDRPDIVEVNEPTMLGAWPTLILATFAILLSNSIRRSDTKIVFYAIDNLNPVEVFMSYTRLPRVLSRMIVRMVMLFLLIGVRRIAFGSDGAASIYRELVGDRLLDKKRAVRIFPALSSPCTCGPDSESTNRNSVLFVGSFEERKGVRELLQSWPGVKEEIPAASLTLIGTGPMEAEVELWAGNQSGVEIVHDPPRRVIHERLRSAHCLVLLSRRTPRWREQVGLPILEGLSHGCEIVATSESGISGWLASHSHQVLKTNSCVVDVVDAICRSLRSTRSRSEVLSSLPAEDARLAADHWMMGDGSQTFRHGKQRDLML